MKFKRMEYFASKDRKLDEIRHGDLIEYENGMSIVREVKDDTVYFGDHYDTRCEAWPSEVILIQTAEELQTKLVSVINSLKDSPKKDRS